MGTGSPLALLTWKPSPFTGVVWKPSWHFDVFESLIHLLANRCDLVRISVTECDRKSKIIVASKTRDLFSFLGEKKEVAAGSAEPCGSETLETRACGSWLPAPALQAALQRRSGERRKLAPLPARLRAGLTCTSQAGVSCTSAVTMAGTCVFWGLMDQLKSRASQEGEHSRGDG